LRGGATGLFETLISGPLPYCSAKDSPGIGAVGSDVNKSEQDGSVGGVVFVRKSTQGLMTFSVER